MSERRPSCGHITVSTRC